MVRYHQCLNGCEFEKILGENEGQGSLACCSQWGRKESNMTLRLKKNKIKKLNNREVK